MKQLYSTLLFLAFTYTATSQRWMQDLRNKTSVFMVINVPSESLDSAFKTKDSFFIDIAEGNNGTAFFIDNNKMVTAYHVLNSTISKSHKSFFVNLSGNVIDSFKILEEYPNLDVTIFEVYKFSTPLYYKPTENEIKNTDSIVSIGFDKLNHQSFKIYFGAVKDRMELIRYDIPKLETRQNNFIRFQQITEIHSTDEPPIILKKMHAIILGNPLSIGFSGGPSIDMKTGNVIGLTSMTISESENKLSRIVDRILIIPSMYFTK